jgi:protein gp37
MGAKSSIEWTESTWNPVTGCTKISPGCDHCYAERLALRLQAMGQPNYADGFRLTVQEHMLELPLRWKLPQVIFVNSMSDLFHKDVPTEYIQRVFDVMRRASQHRFQVLTKRSQRLARLSSRLSWQPNIWMGVSVESQGYTFRIDHLRETDAHIKFLSLEPLLGPLTNLNLEGIDGYWIFATNAKMRAFHSSSNNGAAPTKRRLGDYWMIELGMRCPWQPQPFNQTR